MINIKGFLTYLSNEGDVIRLYSHILTDYSDIYEPKVVCQKLYVIEKIENKYSLIDTEGNNDYKDLIEELYTIYGTFSERLKRDFDSVTFFEEKEGKKIKITLSVKENGDDVELVSTIEQVERVSDYKMGFYEVIDKENTPPYTMFVDEIGNVFSVRQSLSHSCKGTIYEFYLCDFNVEVYGLICDTKQMIKDFSTNKPVFKGLKYEYMEKYIDCARDSKSFGRPVTLTWHPKMRRIFHEKGEEIAY